MRRAGCYDGLMAPRAECYDRPIVLLDVVLGQFAWWRRHRGGHWELWAIEEIPESEWDPLAPAPEWHRLDWCTALEDWPDRTLIRCEERFRR